MSAEAGARDPGTLLALAREVALEAAALVRSRRLDAEVAETKSSPTDVVTAVDHASEELVRGRLLSARPGDGFVGEEGDDVPSTSGVTWVVDPIDGTVNFLYGLPQYAVSVAAQVEATTVAGVVVDVARGVVFSAARGQGAHLDGEPLRVRVPAPREQRLVLTGFAYVREVRAAQARGVARLLEEVRDVRRQGAAALDLCAVAAGWGDAYVEEGLCAWDLAAGELLVREAGGRVEQHPGAGGGSCTVAAPGDAFADTLELARECGLVTPRGPE